MANWLSAGHLDIALVPAFEALRSPECAIVDGVSIAAEGAVYSVYLAAKTPIGEVTRVSLDPASLTSANLLRCIFGEFYGIEPEYVAEPGNGDARMLIGNQAIEFRKREGDAWHYHDLGEVWTRNTGLPFVFAVWLMRTGGKNPTAAANELRALKEIGRARIDAICEAEPKEHQEFCREYLTGHIRYDLAEREKAGLDRFQKILVRRGLLPPDQAPLRFV